ncbi:MAG: F0F1 ATP synthase subunit A, partial [Flavobacteriaceae bacterium]|nr:F0F1 ATP synthase subunit A [Flavobacteriaceae bacterium]
MSRTTTLILLKKKSLFLIALLFAGGLFAKENEQNQENLSAKEIQKKEIKEYIMHHLQDSYDFSLFSYTNEAGEHVYFGAPLPIILWDNGLKIFSSSKLHHGETVAEVEGNHYAISHNKIYKTDASGTITYDEEHHATNIAPLDFSITKGVVSIMFTFLLMFFLFKNLADSYAKNGGIASGAGRFFEPIVLYIRDDIAIPNIGEKKYRKYMSFLLTVFFFVWFLNMLGLTPLGINVTGNIAVTLCLALITFLLTNLTGTKDYWLHIFDPLGSTMK